MATRGLLGALLLLTVTPQTQPRLPVHVESLEYPALARQARIRGDVNLFAYIDSDGRVTGWPELRSGNPLLAQVAEENLRTWRFQPCANSELKITYHFTLEGESTDHSATICKFDLPDSVTVVAHPPSVDTNYSSHQKPE